MKEQFTPGEWLNEGTTVYALQDSTRHGKPIKINRFQFNIQGKCSSEELLANAILAKVAPKMYRLLADISKSIDHCGDEVDVDFMKDSIDKLMAEARGENNER